jgi:hypothetical protein
MTLIGGRCLSRRDIVWLSENFAGCRSRVCCMKTVECLATAAVFGRPKMFHKSMFSAKCALAAFTNVPLRSAVSCVMSSQIACTRELPSTLRTFMRSFVVMGSKVILQDQTARKVFEAALPRTWKSANSIVLVLFNPNRDSQTMPIWG